MKKESDAVLGLVIEKALKGLPQQMDTDELAALLLTIIDRYVGMQRVSEGISLLLTSAVVYARATGISDKKMAALLLACALDISGNETTNKVH